MSEGNRIDDQTRAEVLSKLLGNKSGESPVVNGGSMMVERKGSSTSSLHSITDILSQVFEKKKEGDVRQSPEAQKVRERVIKESLSGSMSVAMSLIKKGR